MTNNRQSWNADSDRYQAVHGSVLDDTPMAWGVWRIAESELRVLGDCSGRRVLELGCGAGQWSLALSARGARVVGIDLSEGQLGHARAAARRLGLDVPLVHGDAERLPFGAASFDVVFCDHGAMSFASPDLTVREASRVLKPGGVFAFCMATPVLDVCVDQAAGHATTQLLANYFGLSTLDDGRVVCYQRPYGVWIRLFREHALQVEDLVELRPPEDATTTYVDYVPLAWARRWPAEHIWKLRKENSE
jgi:SAM-dependent methyltransferase